jgi:hypothetical protein
LCNLANNFNLRESPFYPHVSVEELLFLNKMSESFDPFFNSLANASPASRFINSILRQPSQASSQSQPGFDPFRNSMIRLFAFNQNRNSTPPSNFDPLRNSISAPRQLASAFKPPTRPITKRRKIAENQRASEAAVFMHFYISHQEVRTFGLALVSYHRFC